MSDTVDKMAEEFKIAYPLTYDAIYEKGRADAFNEIDNILNADMTISEVLTYLIRFIDKAKGRNRNDLDREKSV